MIMERPTVSVDEVRAILGEDARRMCDDEIRSVISNLDEKKWNDLIRRRDARDLANLIYDCYLESKTSGDNKIES